MSDSDDENNTGSSKEQKRVKNKICRHFAYGLITNAFEMRWEPHEVANLILLIVNQLSFNHEKLVKLLESTNSGTPAVLVILIDNGHEFTVRQLIALFMNQAGSIHKYISYVADALDVKLFDFKDDETLTALINVVTQNDMTYTDTFSYARELCEQCRSKRRVGKLLSELVEKRFTMEEGASFIHDMVTLDFFLDIKGDVHSFYNQLGRCKDRLMDLLSSSNHLNKRGEIVDADEDDEGNLKDFVCGEDEISLRSSSSIESDEEALLTDSEVEEEERGGKKKHKKDKKDKKKKSSSKKVVDKKNKQKKSKHLQVEAEEESDNQSDSGIIDTSSDDEEEEERHYLTAVIDAASPKKVDGGMKKKRKFIIHDEDDEEGAATEVVVTAEDDVDEKPRSKKNKKNNDSSVSEKGKYKTISVELKHKSKRGLIADDEEEEEKEEEENEESDVETASVDPLANDPYDPQVLAQTEEERESDGDSSSIAGSSSSENSCDEEDADSDSEGSAMEKSESDVSEDEEEAVQRGGQFRVKPKAARIAHSVSSKNKKGDVSSSDSEDSSVASSSSSGSSKSGSHIDSDSSDDDEKLVNIQARGSKHNNHTKHHGKQHMTLTADVNQEQEEIEGDDSDDLDGSTHMALQQGEYSSSDNDILEDDVPDEW